MHQEQRGHNTLDPPIVLEDLEELQDTSPPVDQETPTFRVIAKQDSVPVLIIMDKLRYQNYNMVSIFLFNKVIL